MRVLLFAERLSPPPDEGIKKLALSLAAALRAAGHDLLTLTTEGTDWPEHGVINIPADRLLRSPKMADRLAGYRPQVILYVPTASLTLASGLRARTLRRYAAAAPVALIATQGRRHKALVRLAARFAAPDLCVVQSSLTETQARRLGWRTLRVPPGVDVATFRPASPEARLALRQKHGVPAGACVALHVGHLRSSRGVTSLATLADVAYPVLVTSTSTPQDQALADDLRRAGVHVMTHYLEQIQEMYQLADLYLFPTPPNPTAPGSIDLPLSVLEAMACDLPVLATRFGALPELWPNQPGVRFYDDAAGLRAGVVSLRSAPAHTRELALPLSWRNAAQQILNALAPTIRPDSDDVIPAPAGIQEPYPAPHRPAPNDVIPAPAGIQESIPPSIPDPALAWAAYLAAAWWQGSARPGPAGVDPGDVVALLRRNGLPLLTQAADSRPAAAALLATAPFQAALAEDRAELARQSAAFAEIQAAWDRAGIPALFVKALGPLPSLPYTSGNLDILAPQARQDEARKLVRDLGYVELRHIEEPNKFLLRRHRAGQPTFDIHIHGRLEWHVSFLDEAAVWQHSSFPPDTGLAPAAARGLAAVPAREDGVLITLAHAVYENKALKLGELAKVLYAVRIGPLDWDRMIDTARRKGWLPGLWFSLELCARLEGALYGSDILRQACPRAPAAAMTRRQTAYLDTLVEGAPNLPVRIAFLASKRLFYAKMLADTTRPVTGRGLDIISHTLYGARVRLRLRSQKPMLIALDGIDGCGKSAHAALLAAALEESAIRHRVVWTRGGSSAALQPLLRLGKQLLGRPQPAASPASPRAHGDLESERAATFRHPLVQGLWPWLIALEAGVSYARRIGWPLLRGEVVIADRYLLSTLMELAARLDRPDIGRTVPGRILKLLAPRPRFSFWFDVPSEVALARKAGQESPAFLQRQATLLPGLAAEMGATRLDGTRPLAELNVELVTQVLRDYLDAHRTLLNGLFWANPRRLPRPWREEA